MNHGIAGFARGGGEDVGNPDCAAVQRRLQRGPFLSTAGQTHVNLLHL